MPVIVKIPAPLRPLTQGQSEVSVENAATVQAAVEDLSRRYPGLRERLLDEKGGLRRYVNIFRNDEDIRHRPRQMTTAAFGPDALIDAIRLNP